ILILYRGDDLMLRIILNDGSEYENDPKLGWNLETREEIQEVFDEIDFMSYVIKKRVMKEFTSVI
ncbi:hypothetical protein P9G78_22980, partial [Bacillus subtilis]|uniref:hypothetical protein n=2 Tax=Bacillus subtilis TaxID=1423 RepID=UPI002DBB6077